MALTLLQTVNLLLRDAAVVYTDLTALTAQTQQADVDGAVSSINEVVDELESLGLSATGLASSTITLVGGTRAYPLAIDFVDFADGILIDETNGQVIEPFPGGFFALRNTQLIPANWTGLAYQYAIEPDTGKIYLANIPTAAEAGRIYKYWYKKETAFSSASPAATFPFVDEAVRQMLPACVEVFRRLRKSAKWEAGPPPNYNIAVSRVAEILRKEPNTQSYGPGLAA